MVNVQISTLIETGGIIGWGLLGFFGQTFTNTATVSFSARIFNRNCQGKPGKSCSRLALHSRGVALLLAASC